MTVKGGGMWSTMCLSAIPFSILPAMMRVRREHVLRHFTLSSLKADSALNRQIRFPPLRRNLFVTLWMKNCLNCAPSVLISNWRRIMHIPVCCIVEWGYKQSQIAEALFDKQTKKTQLNIRGAVHFALTHSAYS